MNEALQVAKEKSQENKVVTLSTGIRAILHPVSASLIQEVVSKIVDPPVPVEYNEAKGVSQENPHNKEYQATITANNQKRARASMDAFALFGLELVDGLPSSDKWLKKLKQMERLGYLDLSEFDLDDDIDLEFIFKRYIAMSASDFTAIGKMTGISQEDIAAAESSF
jgi:hypothetical protein